MTYMPLPIGVDDFKTIITKEYYYVDKTWLIKDLLDRKGEVSLFTRPRRFGKTLNLSMLKYYFERPADGADTAALFTGLKIMDAGEKYTREMQQYPVITLTLKSAKQPTWELACLLLKREICSEYQRHQFIFSDQRMKEKEERYRRIMSEKGEPGDYVDSLKFLSQCLAEYYQKNTIILIDEYDVPLENAYYAGFYDRMVGFIRSLFESALKTNPYLEFSVITGCLRISKESIFTGLNNLNVISILNTDYAEYFGFTEQEVEDMLAFYHREKQLGTIKEWYDGYLFGASEVYNPWSVINYVSQLYGNENAFPTALWSNTSSNSIVKDLIYRADDAAKGEIEILVNGGTIEKPVHEDITYEDIYASEDNLWNFLFFTGYLKADSVRMEHVNRYVTMSIPNHELLYIYENTIAAWFRDEVKKDNLGTLYHALLDGKADLLERELNGQLRKMISYMDGRELFYHGFLLGLLGSINCIVKSNREAGTGRYDILVRSTDLSTTPVIIELKVAGSRSELEGQAEAALRQIGAKGYDADLYEEGYDDVLYCGLAFYRKQVRVKMERKRLGL